MEKKNKSEFDLIKEYIEKHRVIKGGVRWFFYKIFLYVAHKIYRKNEL